MVSISIVGFGVSPDADVGELQTYEKATHDYAIPLEINGWQVWVVLTSRMQLMQIVSLQEGSRSAEERKTTGLRERFDDCESWQ